MDYVLLKQMTYPRIRYSAIIVNKIENLLSTVNIGKLKSLNNCSQLMGKILTVLL